MRAILQSRPANPLSALPAKLHAMDQAIQSLIQGGCTTVWDSTTDGQSGPLLARSPLRHYLFHEILGLTQGRAEPLWNLLPPSLRSSSVSPPENLSHPPSATNLGHGLNPHAPYSVGPWLRQRLRTSPPPTAIAWHLAESPDEEALFQSATGSIAELYQDFQLPLPFTSCPRSSSFDFLIHEHLADSCTVAFHCNHLAREQALSFSGYRAIVHCPATHLWFDRPPVPLAQWLNAGINVCLGTDSLASSDSLSMLDMIRLTAHAHPDLTADQLLQMACFNPTKVRLINTPGGQIQPGHPTDLVALSPPTKDPTWSQTLSSSETTVEKVWINSHPIIPT